MKATYRLVALVMSSAPLVAAISATSSLQGDLGLEAAVKAAYQREFGETVERPAIYNTPHAAACPSEGHLTTTAYIEGPARTSTLLSLYMSRDGTTVIGKRRDLVLTPKGTFRTLVIFVRYPETVPWTALSDWKAAQTQVNNDHATFARSRNRSSPLVIFDNTNLVIASDEIEDTQSPLAVRDAATRRGISTRDYEIVITIDINPLKPAGGHSRILERFVYMGNFGQWQRPLEARDWVAVANAAYHHEVAHLWGWPGTHDWVDCSRGKPDYFPFIAPPILFGWEDATVK